MVFSGRVRVIQMRRRKNRPIPVRRRHRQRLPADEVFADARAHHHAAGAQSRPEPGWATQRQRGPRAPTAASSGAGTGRRRRPTSRRLSPGPRGPSGLRRCWAGRLAPTRQGSFQPSSHMGVEDAPVIEPICPARTALGVLCPAVGMRGRCTRRSACRSRPTSAFLDARVLPTGGWRSSFMMSSGEMCAVKFGRRLAFSHRPQGRDASMSASHVRRDKAAHFQWVQAPPGNRSSRKQPEQAWRRRKSEV